MALEDFSTDEGCNVRILLFAVFFFFVSPCSSQGGKVLGWKQSAARPPATTCLAFAVSIKPHLVCKTESLLAGRSQERRDFCYEVTSSDHNSSSFRNTLLN